MQVSEEYKNFYRNKSTDYILKQIDNIQKELSEIYKDQSRGYGWKFQENQAKTKLKYLFNLLRIKQEYKDMANYRNLNFNNARPGNYFAKPGYNKNYRNNLPPKHSGAKFGVATTKAGQSKKYLRCWNWSKARGTVVLTAFQNVKSKEYESGNGNKFISLMAEVVFQNTGQKHLEVIQYNITSGKAMLSKLGWIVATKAPRGGYFGKYRQGK